MILERLVRRVGHDAVAEHMPEAHRKLLTHIRKEQLRKHRTRESEAGSQVGFEPQSRLQNFEATVVPALED